MKKQLLLLLLTLLPASLFAQGVSGKITGKVTDQENKEPLIKATVRVEGTKLGAVTDLEGNYTILNVPVGTYKLNASYVGYTNLTIDNVKVTSSLVTRADFPLSTKEKVIGDIVITATRPLVEPSATTKTMVITQEQIQNAPVRGSLGFVGLQAGVVQDQKNQTDIYVRGGRSGEVAFYVDGILQNNPLNNRFSGNISNDAIQEIVVQSSFDAEFGNAGSGIVNVATREPARDNYNVSLHYITDAFLPKRARNETGTLSSYGYSLVNGSLSGPVIPKYKDLQFYGLFEYNDQQDRSPTQGFGILPGNGGKQYNGVFKLNFDAGAGINIKLGGNYTRNEGQGIDYINFGGLTNAGGANFDNIRGGSDFNTVLVRNANGEGIRYDFISPNDLGQGQGTNTIHQIYSENSVSQAYLRYTQTISSKSYLQIQAQYSRTFTETMDNKFRRNFASYTPQFVQVPNFSDAFGLMIQNGRMTRNYSRQLIDFWEFRGDYEAQLGSHNIKAGGQFRYHNYKLLSFDPSIDPRNDNPTYIGYTPEDLNYAPLTAWYNDVVTVGREIDPATGLPVITSQYRVRDDITRFDSQVDAARSPIIASAYIKDRYSLKDFNINFGLRFDFLDANTRSIADIRNPVQDVQLVRIPGDTTNVKDIVFAKNSSIIEFQPRVSFSFPVSEETVFHVSYGRFAQMPQLRYLYDSKLLSFQRLQGTGIGRNPNLGAEITNTYELGFQQQLGAATAIDVTAFYKEVSNLIQVTRIQGQAGAVNFFGNTDFSTIRGFDVTLRSQRFNYLNLAASYTLQFAGGTNSDPTAFQEFFRRNGEAEFTPTAIGALGFDQRHTGNVNIDFRIPLNDQSQPSFFRGFGVNALLTFGSGSAYTPVTFNPPSDPTDANSGLQIRTAFKNSSYSPWTYQLDLKIDRQFKLFDKLNMTAYIWALNVLGTANAVGIWATTGSSTEAGFTQTPEFQANIDNILARDFNRGGISFRQILTPQQIEEYNQRYREQYNAIQRTPDFIGLARQFRLGIMLGL
jgi:outer membrane receptor protein involved in Fe transport